MADKPVDMNQLLRDARGFALPEPKTKRERKEQHAEMNRLLRQARGVSVEAKPDEEGDDDA
jgi:hypothetical protein